MPSTTQLLPQPLPQTLNYSNPAKYQYSLKSYAACDRPLFRWKGYSLALFDCSHYFYHSKERNGIDLTNEHRSLIRFYRAQIRDIKSVHRKELRLLARKKRIALKRCKPEEKANILLKFDTNLEVLQFQQRWEKNIVYCRLRIEFYSLRENPSRKLLSLPELTEYEKECWNETFLNKARKKQWETLCKIEEVFSAYLREPFSQPFDSYFGKFGVGFGWYHFSDLGTSGDGANSPIQAWDTAFYTTPDSLDSEDTESFEKTVCGKTKKVI
jgi:hypothetical protein